MKKILIAEDEEFLRSILATKLKASGHEIIEAVDGEDALVKLKETKVDMVLLDLMMPKVNGFDVLKAIREDPATKDLKVIILSNLGQDTDIQKCRDLGIIDYIVKSDSAINDIVTAIEKHLV